MDFRGMQGVAPMKMSGNLSENWKFWKQRFQTYLLATEISKKEEITQCAQLLTLIGEEGMRIYNTFTFQPDEENKIKPLLDQFEHHFTPKRNLTYQRHKLLTCKQRSGETIEQYITELKNLALACELGDLQEDLTKDILICGLQSERLREKLLQEDHTKLDDAIRVCISMEKTKERSREITNSRENGQVDAVGRNPVRRNETGNGNRVTKGTSNRSSSRNSQEGCRKCGRVHGYGKCPAYGRKCNTCGKMNHFASQCQSKKVGNQFNRKNKFESIRGKNKYNKINVVENDSDEGILYSDNVHVIENSNENNFLFVGSIESGSICDVEMESWVAPLEINGHEIQMKIDTGAMANVIPIAVLRKINFNVKNLNQTKVKLTSYTRDPLPVIGECVLNCRYKEKSENFTFYVVNMNSSCILGLKACTKLELIKSIDQVREKENVSNKKENFLTNKYENLFHGIGCLEKTYTIELKNNYKPAVHMPRKVPFAIQDKFK